MPFETKVDMFIYTITTMFLVVEGWNVAYLSHFSG